MALGDGNWMMTSSQLAKKEPRDEPGTHRAHLKTRLGRGFWLEGRWREDSRQQLDWGSPVGGGGGVCLSKSSGMSLGVLCTAAMCSLHFSLGAGAAAGGEEPAREAHGSSQALSRVMHAARAGLFFLCKHFLINPNKSGENSKINPTYSSLSPSEPQLLFHLPSLMPIHPENGV